MLHVLAHIDSSYLQQIAVDELDPRQMRRAIARMVKALQAQNPELPQPARSNAKRKKVTSNKKKKSISKKKRTRKASTKRSREEIAETTLDAIGLARLETFKDFPGSGQRSR